MKILMFAPYYYPHTGGVENYAEQLNKYLSKKVTSITVFTPNIPATSSEIEEVSKNITIIRYPALDAIPNYPIPKFWSAKYWKLKRQIYKNDYDLVISHTRFFHSSLLACQYAKKKDVKWAHVEHGSDYVQTSNPVVSFVAKKYDHSFGKKVLRASDINISISKSVQKFVNIFDSRISPVIHRGIEIEEIDLIKPNTKLKSKYKNKKIILFAGRLIASKGVPDLINALNTIKENKSWICLILGDGEDKNKLKKLVSHLQLDDRIIFLGNLPLDKVIGYKKSMDIFVCPSYTEGLATTILESAVCGKAIIATSVGGAPEIIRNNIDGLLPPAGQPDELAKKIESLLNNNKLRREFGENIYKSVVKEFNWPKNSQKFLDTLNELLD